MEPLKVFLDTNIVLDYLTGRTGDTYSSQIVQVGKSPCYQLCISFLTAANVMYCARKYSASVSACDLSKIFKILPQDEAQWDEASKHNMDDFEDSLQLTCAIKSNCACIISRDRHFIGSPLPVFDPLDFLDTVVRNFAKNTYLYPVNDTLNSI